MKAPVLTMMFAFMVIILAGLRLVDRPLAQTGPSSGGSGNASSINGTTINTVPASGNLVGTTDTQTLTGKSIVATQLTGTVAAAQMPALTGDCTTSVGAIATTCTKLNGVAVTAPASGILAGTTDSQTLTNKTLTAPIISGAGTIDGMAIGGTTPGAGAFTTITHTGVEIAAGCMDFQAPATGATINVGAGICEEMIAPSGTLATLTTNLIASPANGQKLRLRFTQIITALTVGGGGSNSIVGNPVSAALGATIDCIYRTSNTTWYC